MGGFGFGAGLGALGGAQFSPEDIAGGPWLWFDASDPATVTVTGAGVSEWVDKAGSGNATQSTDADRPGYSATAWSLDTPRGGVVFDKGNTEYLDLGAIANASHDYTICVALDQRSTAIALQVLLSTFAGSSDFITAPIENAGDVGGFENGSWRAVANPTAGRQVLTFQWDATANTLEVFRDGTSIGTASYTSNAMAFGVTTHMGKYRANATMHIDAVVGEVLVYDSVISAGERQKLERYAEAKWLTPFPTRVIANNGQSNAAASSTNFSGVNTSAAALEGEDMLVVLSTTAWAQAVADDPGGAGSLAGCGQWSARLGRSLIERDGGRVLFVNTADDGKPISWFAKTSLEQTPNNYTRMQTRLTGLSPDAYIWWQGEGDAVSATPYADYLAAIEQLYADLVADVPSLTKFVVVQIASQACGSTLAQSDDIRAALSDFVDAHASDPCATILIDLDDLTGGPGHDGCHYAFTDGYEEAGLRIFAVL